MKYIIIFLFVFIVSTILTAFLTRYTEINETALSMGWLVLNYIAGCWVFSHTSCGGHDGWIQ